LLSKIETGEVTTNLAEARVVAAWKAGMKEVHAEDLALNLAQKKGSPGACSAHAAFCGGSRVENSRLDSNEGRVRFSYVPRDGGHYFTRVLIEGTISGHSPAACDPHSLTSTAAQLESLF
jgi:hypothetical protein